jgi:hypothetical protein
MVRLKVRPVRLAIFFVVVLIACFAVVQAHLTQAQPERVDSSLKTIAHIVVHAHHKPAQLNKGS